MYHRHVSEVCEPRCFMHLYTYLTSLPKTQITRHMLFLLIQHLVTNSITIVVWWGVELLISYLTFTGVWLSVTVPLARLVSSSAIPQTNSLPNTSRRCSTTMLWRSCKSPKIQPRIPTMRRPAIIDTLEILCRVSVYRFKSQLNAYHGWMSTWNKADVLPTIG